MAHQRKLKARPAATDNQRDCHEAITALATYRRDAILEAVAVSAKELLRSANLDQSMPKVTECIGLAAGVDRVHILELADVDDRGEVVEHYMWTAPGIKTPPLFEHAKGMTMAEVGLKSWLRRLAAGEVMRGHTRGFEASVREFFAAAGVKSAMAVPIFADAALWGHIGFNDCRKERDWSAAEIDTLRTLAELIGAAVARTHRLRTLADANRIVENSATILFRLDLKPPFLLTFVSYNISRYGYQADKLLAHPERWAQLIDAADLPAMIDDIHSIAEGKIDSNRREFRLHKPDGSIVWFDGQGTAIRNSENRPAAVEGVLVDITDRKLAAEKIAALAHTDALTGLANRTAFLERLGREFARAQGGAHQFAVHYLDLDYFKDVNDTLGHPNGDALLCAVAARLKSCVAATDLVARFGGDEFAVLQNDTADAAHVAALAAKIGKTLAAPFAIAGNQVHTTVSIGIVPYRNDLATIDAMLVKADLALYRAKNEGRNQFRFHVVELDRQIQERMVMSEELRRAIETGEFELFYQPQMALRSGSIVGLEALIRWNHPKHGLMLPSTFIPIAETTGSIASIGKWVIEQACRQIKAWSDAGMAPPIVAVNLSGAQFKLTAQLDQIIADNLARYNVAPERLELELTESVLIEATQRHGEIFRRLRDIGVRFAIDDFGIGYSSLDYLRSFHVARLKIDRRFITDVTIRTDAAAIVRAIIGLARELGIEVIAEGVETAGQRDFLIAAGCELAQGYYFGKPVPAVAISEILQQKVAEFREAAPESARVIR